MQYCLYQNCRSRQEYNPVTSAVVNAGNRAAANDRPGGFNVNFIIDALGTTVVEELIAPVLPGGPNNYVNIAPLEGLGVHGPACLLSGATWNGNKGFMSAYQW